jgi:hypothetical protein
VLSFNTTETFEAGWMRFAQMIQGTARFVNQPQRGLRTDLPPVYLKTSADSLRGCASDRRVLGPGQVGRLRPVPVRMSLVSTTCSLLPANPSAAQENWARDVPDLDWDANQAE